MVKQDYKQLTENWLVQKVEEQKLSNADLVEIFQRTLERLGVVDRKTATQLTGLSPEGLRKCRKNYKLFNYYLVEP